MSSANARLKALNLELPPLPAPIGNYGAFRIGGDTLYTSGVGPRHNDGSVETGKVGADVSVTDAAGHARLCGLNLLSIMQHALDGDLDRVTGVLKVFGMVNAVPDFADHPKVIDGCTDLFVEVFGDAGRPARSAIGMGSLPRNITVEIEAIVLIKP
jgi:enamine deaminase RidA (YjgF/YER057c/UK114 family)